MTVAVCIRCGARKHGAWTSCPACGFLPEDEVDLAKSVQLTDHYLGQSDLDGIGERIKSGEPVGYDQAHLTSLIDSIKADPVALKGPIGCRIAVWTPIVIMLILFVALAVLLVWLKVMAS